MLRKALRRLLAEFFAEDLAVPQRGRAAGRMRTVIVRCDNLRSFEAARECFQIVKEQMHWARSNLDDLGGDFHKYFWPGAHCRKRFAGEAAAAALAIQYTRLSTVLRRIGVKTPRRENMT
jgi:hypothetical protein